MEGIRIDMSERDPFEHPIPASGGRPWRQASEGPVNWQVAEQVAAWMARESAEGVSQCASDLRFDELFRVVELRTESLVPPLPPGTVSVFSPSLVSSQEWARSSVQEFKYTLETIASRLTAASEVGPGEIGPVQAIVGPIMPVLLGAQFGLLLGKMAAWIWSGFDVLLPRTAAPEAKVLPAAVTRSAASYGVDQNDAGLWVCLHEYAHLRQFMVPWLRRFLAIGVQRAVSEIRFDPEAVADKVSTLDPSDPSSFETFAQDPTGLLEALIVPPPVAATDLLRSCIAVLEAYAEHICAVAAVQIARDPDKAREVMHRHHFDRGSAERLLLRLSGIELDSHEFATALAFCQFVTAEEGIETLQRLWKGPKYLPTFEEMQDPRRWLDRTAQSE